MSKKIEITDRDRAEIEEMAKVGLRPSEISVIKGLSVIWLNRHCKKEMRRGRKAGNMALLKTAYRMAVDKENTTMAIFLLKTRCGMREKERVKITVENKEHNRKREELPTDPIKASSVYLEHIRGIK